MNVKKVFLRLTFLSVFFILSCSKQMEADPIFPNDYAFGVIQSTDGPIDLSMILLYNAEGELIHKHKIPYGGIYLYRTLPPVNEQGSLFMPAEGILGKRTKKLMNLNLYTGFFEFYDIDYGLNTVAVFNNNLYSVSHPAQKSVLFRYDLQTKILHQEDLYGHSVDRFITDSTHLYVFAKDEQYIGSFEGYWLFIMNPQNFHIKEKINISKEKGSLLADALHFNNQLFFTYNMEPEQSNINNYRPVVGGHLLGQIDVHTKAIKFHHLEHPFPYQLLQYKDKIVISHHDFSQNSYNGITIFEPITQEEQHFALPTPAIEIRVQKDYLYVFSYFFSDLDHPKIYQYQLPDFTLLKVYNVGLSKIESQFSPQFENYSGVSTFFLNPKND